MFDDDAVGQSDWVKNMNQVMKPMVKQYSRLECPKRGDESSSDEEDEEMDELELLKKKLMRNKDEDNTTLLMQSTISEFTMMKQRVKSCLQGLDDVP